MGGPPRSREEEFERRLLDFVDSVSYWLDSLLLLAVEIKDVHARLESWIDFNGQDLSQILGVLTRI